MSPSHEPRERGSLYLPQYGFGSTVDFSSLIEHNRFLFRVYTPKERSPFFDNTEPFFIAPRFDERYRNPSPGGPMNWELDGSTAIADATYQDIVRHMDWTTRSLSPYISTSFSAIWAIWEAVRRYHHGVKQDVHIAIIDAHTLSERAITAAYLLTKASPQERHEGHWKWFRFCQESQAVFVYGAIPGNAVLASVPLTDLLRNLPSYFLKDRTDHASPFNRLAWDYTERKPNFRLFCRDMSNHFRRLPHEEQLQVATTGSVELAVALMRPWFHQAVIKDSFNSATEKLRILAFSIAQWPCQWRTLERPEIRDLISGIITAIAEELREKGKEKGQKRGITHLQEAIHELEYSLVECESQLEHARSQAVKYHDLAASLRQRRWEECSRATLASHLPTPRASPLLVKRREKDTTQIPLPLPAGASHSPESHSPILSVLPIIAASTTGTKPPPLLLSPSQLAPLEDAPLSSSPTLSPTLSTSTMANSEESDDTSTVLSTPPRKQSIELQLFEDPQAPSHEPSPTDECNSEPDFAACSPANSVAAEFEGKDLLDDDMWIEGESCPIQKIPVFVEAASYIATGFLVGAIITLCLFSHRRVALLSAT